MFQSMQALTFLVEGHAAAVPLDAVRELSRLVATDPLPGTPAVVAGLLNYRGEPCPVFDMRLRLGLGPGSPDPDQHLVVVSRGDGVAALWVDRATGVVTIDPDDVRAAPEVGAVVHAVRGVVPQADYVLVICDLDGFLSRDEELQLARALEAVR